MNKFCIKCGSPLAEGAAFCVQCGTPASAQAISPPPAPAAAPSSSGSKLILIVGGLLLAIVVLGSIGGYLVYRKAKEVVSDAASRAGISMPDESLRSGPARQLDPCSLLTREEAEQITQIRYQKVDSSGAAARATCVFTPVELSADEQQAQVNQALENLKQKADGADAERGDANSSARESGIVDLTKALTGTLSGAGGRLSIAWHGGEGATQINAVRIALRAIAGDLKVSEELKGIGDEALIGPMNAMMVVRKGQDGVVIEYGGPGGKQVLVELARRAASRM
jgi:hypothetical protein